jgi:hypothetical protein
LRLYDPDVLGRAKNHGQPSDEDGNDERAQPKLIRPLINTQRLAGAIRIAAAEGRCQPLTSPDHRISSYTGTGACAIVRGGHARCFAPRAYL